uniref:Polyprotein protein n=1 Tax=Solanum tuberosum TaxID=4113 RepID=M1DQH1_SOLTU
MIEVAILAVLSPLQTSIDTLTMRVKACKSRQGVTSKVSALKVEVADLRKVVDYLKSTNFISLIQAADDVDAPKTSGIPRDTTGDAHRDEHTVGESDAETDEEKIGVKEENIFRDLTDLAGKVVQTSPVENSMVVSSGVVAYEVIPSTDAQV